MKTEGTGVKDDTPELAAFWETFRVLPWKWSDAVTGNPVYLVGSALYVYALLAFLTYFPNNPWVAPKIITDRAYAQFLGANQILPLKHYPSVHFILIGWMIVVVLMILWRHSIPRFFQWLWGSKRLEVQEGDLAREYVKYLQDYQNSLDDKRYPLILSVFLSVLFVALVIWGGVIQFILIHFTPAAAFLILIAVLAGLLWIIIVGQFSWVLYTTAMSIGKLTQRFNVEIQASHPDKCGGLKPVGDFCFGAAVPLIVGGLALAALAILRLDIDIVLSVMATTLIFIVVGPLTALTIFIPLWNIHSEMVERKKTYLDTFAVHINELEKAINLHTKETGDLTKAKEAKEKLEILQVVHPDKQVYPVWPFRFTPTVLAIFSPQILQTAIGIITGLYEFIGNLLK